MVAILFDLDGTLADSLPVILQTSQLACAELDIPWDAQRITDMIGIPLITTGEQLLGPGKGQLYFDTYQKHFFALCDQGMAPYAGVITMLQELQAAGAALAIVTSKSRRGAEATVKALDIAAYIPLVVTINDNCGHKPAPQPALYALEQLDCPAATAVFVGDSIFDMQCACAAQITAWGVTWGACDEPRLRQAGASRIFTTVGQLHQALLAFVRGETGR